MARHLTWLSDAEWARIEPVLPRGRKGARRVDDRRVISGIVHMLRIGARWRDCPPDLIDVANNGAQLHCDAAIRVGAFVAFEYADISRGAKCVRADANRLGLKFNSPLSTDELGRLLNPH